MEMTVVYRKIAGRWVWHLHRESGVMFGATDRWRFKMSARKDFKQRFLAMKRKRPYWPEFKDVEARTE